MTQQTRTLDQTLNELVSKAFCINLYFREDRWKSAARQFAAQGLNIERFNAIDGREFKNIYQGRIKTGNLGCNASHMLIIQTAQIMGFDAIMVLEDDAVLHENFIENMNEILRHVPADWDMIMLGGSHKEAPTKISDKVYRVNKSFCTHAYIMRSTMYKIILDRLASFDIEMDSYLTELQKVKNIYITNPPMVWQLPGYSDIEGRNMSYDFLKSNEQ